MSSKPSYPSEEPNSRILRGYCGVRELMIRPTLYQGLGPVPRRVFAEDEWGKADLQDFKGKSNISLRAAPKSPLKEIRVEWDPRGGTVQNWFRVNTSPPH